MQYNKIQHLSNNPGMEGQMELIQNITYSTVGEKRIELSMILPWSLGDDRIKKEKKPLIVFVQGSAWTTPNLGFQIPQLSEYARMGYVVATLDHRSALDGNAFPAFLQDVKCAIRFLRANSEKYGIDRQRVAIWGTSSGGNAALLVGLTGDDEKYKTEEYKEYSDKVCAVIECFGPTELLTLHGKEEEEPAIPEIDSIMHGLCGGDMDEFVKIMSEMSPVNHVVEGKEVPPFLLMHGDFDDIVPFSQMMKLYNRMVACKYNVEAWEVEGGEHEGTFWSRQVYDVIGEFLKKHLG